MDYYQVLRVPPNASQHEIEKAYRRLLKEARYDRSINLKDVESAYRVLSSQATKQLYDSNLAVTPAKKKKKKKKTLIPTLNRQQLLVLLGILTVITVVYYSLRFGYQLKEFHIGDVIYLNDTGKQLGKIVEIQENHLFHDVKVDAYLIEDENTHKKTWYTQDEIRLHCHKK